MSRDTDPMLSINPREIDARVLGSCQRGLDELVAFRIPDDWGGGVRLAYYSRGFRRSLPVDPTASPTFSWREYRSVEGDPMFSVSVQLGRYSLGNFDLNAMDALYGDCEGMKDSLEGEIKHVIREAQAALEG